MLLVTMILWSTMKHLINFVTSASLLRIYEIISFLLLLEGLYVISI